jgi:hypothetical protein
MSLPSLILLLPRVTSLFEHISAWFQDPSRSPSSLAPFLQELEEVATLLPEESFRHRFVEIIKLLKKRYHTHDGATGESVMLRMILDSGFIHDSELIDDIEELLKVSRLPDSPISPNTFEMTGYPLLMSHLLDFWPSSVVLSPHDCINLHTDKRTLIIDGSDTIYIYNFGPHPPTLGSLHLPEFANGFAHFLGKHLSTPESLMCTALLYIPLSSQVVPEEVQ